MRGLIGLILIGCLLYFTSAGSWLWVRVKSLDTDCYSALGGSLAEPVCSGVAYTIGGLDQASLYVANVTDTWRQRMMGHSDFSQFNNLSQALQEQTRDLASTREKLSEMITRGPQLASTGLSGQQFQQAIDSFAIGQLYLKSGGPETQQGISWLQQGAAQPQGFGLMSQLALGNLYAQGGPGVQANPNAAQAYLEQASGSLGQLRASDSPQAKQMLETLPGSPQNVQKQINRMLREIHNMTQEATKKK